MPRFGGLVRAGVYYAMPGDQGGGTGGGATDVDDASTAILKTLTDANGGKTPEQIAAEETEETPKGKPKKDAKLTDEKAKPDESKKPDEKERDEEGKFKAKAEEGKKDDDATGEDDDAEDPEVVARQKAWDDHQTALAEEAKKTAEPSPADPNAVKTQDAPVAKKEEKPADQPTVGADTAPVFEFTPLTDKDITDEADNQIFKDMIPMRDAYNKMGEQAQKAIATLTSQNAEFKKALDAIVGDVQFLRHDHVVRQAKVLGGYVQEASKLVLDRYGLKIGDDQIGAAVQRAIPFWKQQGWLKNGDLPDAATMRDMWETVNKAHLEKTGITRRDLGLVTTTDDEKNGKPKGAKLVDSGGSPSSTKSDPADEDELILRTLKKHKFSTSG